jgi:hypothetical protein
MRSNYVFRGFWRDPKVRAWGEDARALALYLLTCDERRTEGFFALSPALAAARLGWDAPRLERAFAELAETDFAHFDATAEVVFISRALKYQPPRGPKSVAGAVADVELTQGAPELFARFWRAAERYAPELADGLRERYPNYDGTPFDGPSADAGSPFDGASGIGSPTPTPTPTPTPISNAAAGAAWPFVKEGEPAAGLPCGFFDGEAYQKLGIEHGALGTYALLVVSFDAVRDSLSGAQPFGETAGAWDDLKPVVGADDTGALRAALERAAGLGLLESVEATDDTYRVRVALQMDPERPQTARIMSLVPEAA